MNLLWSAHAWEDYVYWQSTDQAVLVKLNAVIADVLRHPFQGIGKGDDRRIETVACRYHYVR